jgi:uncharacterized protein YqgC (DUF456 family)
MDDITLHTTIIMGVGLLGAVVPVLPGPPLVWLGALYYSYRTDWTEVSWLTLAVLFVSAVHPAAHADVLDECSGAKKTGASAGLRWPAWWAASSACWLLSLPGLFIGSIRGHCSCRVHAHKELE